MTTEQERPPFDDARRAPGGGDASAFLTGGGEMGELIRALDWSQTPIGPVEAWSPALRWVVQLMLANRFPLILWWGPQFIQLYNDPYRPVPGGKHPRSMGQPASECWPEIWHVIGPLIETPFRGGPATWMEDLFLELNRHGFVEETHFTVAYSPVPDGTVSGGIGGVLGTIHEITDQVIGDRRVTLLRDLGAQSAKAKTAEDACTLATRTLAMYPQDIPFALLYLIDEDRQQARLAGAARVAAGQPASPPTIELVGGQQDRSPWPLQQVLDSEAVQTVTNLVDRLGGHVPPGPWTDLPHTAVVVPIHSNKAHRLAGFLVAGISARLQLDDSYRDFLSLVSSQIATAIAHAREYEEERKRAEALAELDRAKTVFFSNVSHEFRTPLTLMLGPLEDLLAGEDGTLSTPVQDRVELIHRSGLRLLRLVNTLLDFSRIEAGRIQASYEPADLATYTADLASVFRSAIERAGLALDVDCPPLPEPVYVDREMWEKIVLNLLSNAFKFTFEGRITVRQRWLGDHVELKVTDTGIGIPPQEIPHLFERFYRVRDAQARTYEGTGIGLALVQELVRLHGGQVSVESEVGRGATFRVSIPTGMAHLPAEWIGAPRTLVSTAVGAAPFVEEALRWLGQEGAPVPSVWAGDVPLAPEGEERARVLLADDNADMRDYVRRLLVGRYQVRAVADGQAALAAARAERPNLVLADVMMPGLDGIALLRALRADPDLRTVPVILLSARAGEEARIEGLEEGADDYVVKPFSARELLARVGAQLELTRIRQEAMHEIEILLHENREQRELLQALFEHAADAIVLTDPQGPGRVLAANPAAQRMFGYSAGEFVGLGRAALLSPGEQNLVALLRERDTAGRARSELRYRRKDGSEFRGEVTTALFTTGDGTRNAVAIIRDVTERRRMERALQESEQKYRELVQHAPAGIYEVDFRNRRFTAVNEAMCEISGYSREELLDMDPFGLLDEAGRARFQERLARWLQGQEPERDVEYRIKTRDGQTIDVILNVTFVADREGKPLGARVVAHDITERKQRERRIGRYNAVLQGINRIFEQVMRAKTEEELADTCLDVALDVTGGAFGFVDEIGADGLLHDIAISDMGWEQCRVVDRAGHRRPPGDFSIHGVYGRVLDTGQSLLTNDPPAHPDSIGVPEGHPALASFLGVPLIHEGRTIGMLAVANRAGGFEPEQQEDLEALAPAVVEALLRRRAEQGRREANERYELVLAGAQAGIWDWDVSGKKVVFSPRWKAMRGLGEHEIDDDEQEWSARIHPEDAPRVMAAVQAHFEGRTPVFAEEYRVRRKDGSWMWIADRGLAQRDADGRVVRMAGSETDITARKQAEEALRESETRFRSVLDNSQDVIYRTNLQTGVYEYISPSAKAVVGYTADELMALDKETSLAMVHPDDVPAMRAALERSEETGTAELEYRQRTKSGDYRWISNHICVIRDDAGRPLYRDGSIRDVTARKQAEEALAESERILRMVLENSQDAINMLDLATGQYLFMSPAQVRLTGFTTEEILGITAEEAYERVHPDDREISIAQQQRIAAGEEAVITAEYRWKVKSGEYRWFSDRRKLVRDEQGRPMALVGVSQDITERKHKEKQLQEALAQAEEGDRMLAALMEYVPEGITIADADMNLIRVSRYGQELLGGSHQGKPVADVTEQWPVWHADGKTPLADEELPLVRAVQHGEVVQDLEVVQANASGECLSLLCTAGPIYDAAGHVTGGIVVWRDITARKRTEQALREHRQLLETVVNYMPVAVNLIRGSDLRLQLANPAYQAIAPGKDMIGKTFDELWPETGKDFAALCLRVLETGKPYYAEDDPNTIRRQPGGPLEQAYFSWSLHRVRLPGEEGWGILNAAWETTARKQAEDALRRYAERLRFLHEVDEAILAAHSMAEVAQAVVDRAPHLLPCRRASVVLYDPQAGQVSLLAAYRDSGHGEPGRAWEGAADVPWDEVLERLAAGHAYEVADVQALPAGSPLVALLQAEGVRALVYEPIVVHGQFVGALKLGLDVPGPLADEQREVVHELAVQLAIGLEQARLYEEVQRYAGNLERLVRQRTAALRASEARFRTIFEEAAIGIALAEPEGRLVASNPALRQMLGYSEQELAGIRFFDLLAGRNGDNKELPPEVLTGKYDDYMQELQYVRKDGETGQANVTVSLLREEEDEPSLLLALVEDVSERKRAQEMLIQTERLAIMGRMAASLAHEVNNPIQSVVGCLGLAMEVLAEGEDAGEYLTVAMEELERAARIVHQMRDLGRQEEGIKEPGDVGNLVDRALLLTRKRAQNQGIEVTWKGAGRLPSVPMVSDRIQQVFLNLVLNAIDAMPRGGKLHVRVVRTKGPRGVAVSFADTGVGIPPEAVARLFDAFHSTKQLGLGLGLFVSRNIIQEHGGRIDVESEEGRGTTFTVWLPGE